MEIVYIVKFEDERLDTIINNHYGTLDYIFYILEINPHIIGKMFLDIGDKILLPDIKIETTNKELNLWD